MVFNGFVLDQNAFVEIDRISSSILCRSPFAPGSNKIIRSCNLNKVT